MLHRHDSHWGNPPGEPRSAAFFAVYVGGKLAPVMAHRFQYGIVEFNGSWDQQRRMGRLTAHLEIRLYVFLLWRS